MKITIKPLTPELAGDYFDFFENRAFTDDSPYQCYCQVYQMTKQQHQAALDNADGADMGQIARGLAERQIADGVLRGYLAYVDGKSIGWCNANDRANYSADPIYDVPFYAPAEVNEIAVICFEISPDYRGKGVATALLHQVIADAKSEGYNAVVSFPVTRGERFEWDFQGPVRLYEKAGFHKVSEKDDKIVMRKELKSQMQLKELVISENLRIRELKIDELELAFPVVNQLRPHRSLEEYIEIVKEMTTTGYQIVCLFDSGKVVSFAGFTRLKILHYGDHIWVYDLVTDENNRGKGYGKLLMSYIENLAEENALQCVALQSGFQRIDAHRFYDNAGYEKVSFVFQKECRSS